MVLHTPVFLQPDVHTCDIERGCSVECLSVGLTAVAAGLDLTLSELGVPK